MRLSQTSSESSNVVNEISARIIGSNQMAPIWSIEFSGRSVYDFYGYTQVKARFLSKTELKRAEFNKDNIDKIMDNVRRVRCYHMMSED